MHMSTKRKLTSGIWKGVFYCDKQPLVITGCKRNLESSSSRWRRRRILSSRPPTDALNPQLHMEQSPLRETRKLAERLLHLGWTSPHPNEYERLRHSLAINPTPGVVSHNQEGSQNHKEQSASPAF